MAELGRRPDVPPEQPDQPAKAPADRARSPEDPPSNSNDDPRAIRDAFRRAEDPAFADSRYEPRAHSRDRGPAGVRPFQTAKDRPEPERGSQRPDALAQRPADLIPPTGEQLAEADAPGASVINRLRKKSLDKETLGDAVDSVKEAGNTLDDAISKPQGPTYSEVQHRSGPSYTAPDHGVNIGDAASAMLVTGIVIGEGARLAYHKMREMKETRHARER